LSRFPGGQPVQPAANPLFADSAYLVDGNFCFFPRAFDL